MKDDYSCGFCERSGKNCLGFDCRVALINENLEELAAKARWEHKLRYLQNEDSELRSCEFCKHLVFEEPAYMMTLSLDKSWCALDDSDEPVKNRSAGCDKWERMPIDGFR